MLQQKMKHAAVHFFPPVISCWSVLILRVIPLMWNLPFPSVAKLTILDLSPIYTDPMKYFFLKYRVSTYQCCTYFRYQSYIFYKFFPALLSWLLIKFLKGAQNFSINMYCSFWNTSFLKTRNIKFLIIFQFQYSRSATKKTRCSFNNCGNQKLYFNTFPNQLHFLHWL